MTASSSSRPSVSHATHYRPDVDGLRAVAVLMVVAYHFFPSAIPGGFVGVDVFFVISGFLITKLIAGEMAAGEFGIARFYARRARRIFPALALVLAASLIAGGILLLPTHYRELGRQALGAVGFVSNLVLYFDTGYFQTEATRNPLLHLWSLGVEEQFYLFWPLMLMLIAPRRRWLAVLFIVIASFACNIVLTFKSPSAAFYLPFSRFWEMAIGGLLALGVTLSPVVTQRGRHIASVCGIACLVASLGLIHADNAFPGWWVIGPVVGAALIIYSGPTAIINRALLQPLPVGIGLISYPLYLWHWPLLTYTRLARFGSEPPPLMKAALIAASFGLAYLTYRWIETPIRVGGKAVAKAAFASLGLAATAMIAGVIVIGNGFPQRFPPSVERMIRSFAGEMKSATRFGTCFLNFDQRGNEFAPECDDGGKANGRAVLIWGDSQAAHLRPGLDAVIPPQTPALQYTAGGCPPVVGFSSGSSPHCRAINDLVSARLQTIRPDTVILSARWSLYDGKQAVGAVDLAQLRATIRHLRAIGVRKIVLLGGFPDWRLAPAEIVVRETQRAMLQGGRTQPLVSNVEFLKNSTLDWDAKLRVIAAEEGTTFVAPRDFFCSQDGCLLRVPGQDDEPTAWDTNHLSPAASVFFARRIADTLIGK